MGIPEQVGSATMKNVVKPGGWLPLYVTAGILFLILVGAVVDSFKEDSIFPIIDRLLIPVVGADADISRLVDSAGSYGQLPVGSLIWGFIPDKNLWMRIWWQVIFWFRVVGDLWFMFFIVWLLYKLFYSMSAIPMTGFVTALLVFLVLNVLTYSLLFPLSLAGLQVTSDKMIILKVESENLIPFHGIYKLGKYVLIGGLFSHVYDFTTSGIGVRLTGLPLNNATELIS